MRKKTKGVKMSSLLQVLENKAKSMDVQIKKARTVSIDEATWIKAKRRVDEFPANLDRIAEEIANCENVVQGTFGKCRFQGKCHRNLVTLHSDHNVVYVREVRVNYEPVDM